jgi:hypothetical protein
VGAVWILLGPHLEDLTGAQRARRQALFPEMLDVERTHTVPMPRDLGVGWTQHR